jgi:hypothetical protein
LLGFIILARNIKFILKSSGKKARKRMLETNYSLKKVRLQAFKRADKQTTKVLKHF